MSHRLAALVLAAPLFACTTVRPAPEPQPARFEVVALEHAPAGELCAVLTRAIQGGIGSPARVVADPRTNSLIVLGDPEGIRRVKAMIEALDREVR